MKPLELVLCVLIFSVIYALDRYAGFWATIFAMAVLTVLGGVISNGLLFRNFHRRMVALVDEWSWLRLAGAIGNGLFWRRPH